jgi:hypothetical protein
MEVNAQLHSLATLVRGLIGPRAGLDAVTKRKIHVPSRNWILFVQPVECQFNDWTSLDHIKNTKIQKYLYTVNSSYWCNGAVPARNWILVIQPVECHLTDWIIPAHIMRPVCKVCGLKLLLQVRTLWGHSDSLFSKVPPLASSALLTMLHTLLKNVLLTIDYFETEFCVQLGKSGSVESH